MAWSGKCLRSKRGRCSRGDRDTGGSRIGLIDIEGAEFSVNRTLSGEPQVDIELNKAPVRELSERVNAEISESAEALGALVRSQQIAGAAEAILENALGMQASGSNLGVRLAIFRRFNII